MIPLAIVHRLRFGSRVILDINERPASVTAEGSTFAIVARIEPFLLRLGARVAFAASVVAPGHASLLQRYGFETILVVRNVPDDEWTAPYRAPEPRSDRSPLRLVLVGSLFEGRALEMLIDAAAELNHTRTPINVQIFGSGRPDYLESLERRIRERRAEGFIELMGPIDRNRVALAYQAGHVGLALYENSDPANDSLSNKIMEIVRSGRPVLAGDLPENRRFVTEHQIGYLTEVSVEGIIDSCRKIYANADIASLSDHCYRFGSQELTWSHEFGPVLHAAGVVN